MIDENVLVIVVVVGLLLLGSQTFYERMRGLCDFSVAQLGHVNENCEGL